MRPKKTRLLHGHQLGEAGQEQLVLNDAMLDPGTVGKPRQRHRFIYRWRRRLLNVDVLACVDGLPDALWAIAGGRTIHKDLIRTSKRLFQAGGPAELAMSGRERGHPLGVAADEQEVGDQPVTVGEFQSPFRGNGQKIGHMLGGSHASGGAVDDDAHSNIRHACPLQPCNEIAGKAERSMAACPALSGQLE
jgi:hypothetical protein